MGVEVSVSKYIAECQRVLEKSGLKYEASLVSLAPTVSEGSQVQESDRQQQKVRCADRLFLLSHSRSCMAVSFCVLQYRSNPEPVALTLFEPDPDGTGLEGEYGEVMKVIEQCHEAIHAMGCVSGPWTTVGSRRGETKTG